jgi:hypothetical protein
MSEIRGVLEEVRTRLNEYIAAAHPRPDEWVILSNVVDQGGQPYEAAKDKVVMALVNICREDTVSTYNAFAPAARGDAYVEHAPPLYVDLYVLFYANFFDLTYTEGLSAVSHVLSFFQQNPVFTRKNLPALPREVDRLTFELFSLDTVELNYVLGMLGAKCLPSAYYKVRLIPFQSGAMRGEAPVFHKAPPAGTDAPPVEG